MSERWIYSEPLRLDFQDVSYETIIDLVQTSACYKIINPHALVEKGIPFQLVESLENYTQGVNDDYAPNSSIRGYDLLNRICDDLSISKESIFEGPANRAIDLQEGILSAIHARTRSLKTSFPFETENEE